MSIHNADEDHRTRMLADIADEVAFTHREIGKNALDTRILDAIAAVPREHFVPASHRIYAFSNGPLPIGHGQTISQPYIVALMTDLLQPRLSATVLEVGTGSGYQAAVLAKLVRHVYSMEIVAPLAEAAEKRLAFLGYDNVTVRHGDGYLGWEEHAPYDGIIVTAAAPHVPGPLLAQLKPGARLVIPVGSSYPQILQVIEKRPDGGYDSRDVLAVAFVPLTRSEAE